VSNPAIARSARNCRNETTFRLWPIVEGAVVMLDRRGMLLKAGASSLVLAAVAGCDDKDKEVGAVEDLMREHGIIRRAILVYRAAAARLRAGDKPDMAALQRTTKLLRNFGEDYHERELEEAHLFPKVKSAGGPAASYIDVLVEQHQRGRVITDRLLQPGAPPDNEALARMLDAFELMYEHHAAVEDTVVFPAWKNALSGSELSEMGEKFEDIEKKRFGSDGFEKAVREITSIEQSTGLAQLAQFTPR
jgi:hemerythrin-like domain-containing protein